MVSSDKIKMGFKLLDYTNRTVYSKYVENKLVERNYIDGRYIDRDYKEQKHCRKVIIQIRYYIENKYVENDTFRKTIFRK